MLGKIVMKIGLLAIPRPKTAIGWAIRLLLLFSVFFSIQLLLDFAVSWSIEYGAPHSPLLAETVGSLLAALLTSGVFYLLRPSEGAATRIEHQRFLAAAECGLDDFYLFDGVPNAAGEIVDFRFSYLNPNAERRLNVQREELIGQVLTEVRPSMITSGLIDRYREVVRTGISFSSEVFLDDERIRATWLNIQVVKLGNGLAITSRDITERKRLDDQVAYLAHYDQLTGLPNRTLLQDRLRQAILRADRYHQKIAIFVFDIDGFKRINDTRGHSEGDAVLTALGRGLQATMRKADTIARMGGDEFIVLMQDFHDLEDVIRCGQEIVRNAARPLSVASQEISITISAGACIYPECGHDPDQLLRKADLAMYVVKKSGGNGLRVFSDANVSDHGNITSQ